MIRNAEVELVQPQAQVACAWASRVGSPGMLSRDVGDVLAAEGVATPCDDPTAPEREAGVAYLVVDDLLLLL